jgi:hypothetical protein
VAQLGYQPDVPSAPVLVTTPITIALVPLGLFSSVVHGDAVRSNLSHRGKSAFQDVQLVHKAVTELRRAMRILLDRQLPAVDG